MVETFRRNVNTIVSNLPDMISLAIAPHKLRVKGQWSMECVSIDLTALKTKYVDNVLPDKFLGCWGQI
jgi:hypothetical protein